MEYEGYTLWSGEDWIAMEWFEVSQCRSAASKEKRGYPDEKKQGCGMKGI